MTDLRVVKNGEELAQAGADIFFRKLESALRSHGLFSVALSGGETPRAMFERIAQSAPPGIDWDKVHFFWVDERNVPRTHSESNFKSASDLLLSHVPVPPANIHRIPTELSTPEEVVQEYERDLRSFFVEQGCPHFDLVFLGLGKDGHTASLFADSVPPPESFDEKENWAAAFWVPSLDAFRFSLTPRAINSAAEIVFLVSGADKSEVLEQALEVHATEGHRIPAQLIAPAQDRVIWIVDHDAAEKIQGSSPASRSETLSRIANQLRIHSIRSTTLAGSGHPTSCCSAADLVAALFFSKMRFDPSRPKAAENDRFILSKGHAAPLLYAAWAETGHFDPELLDTLRKIDSPFEGHPTPKLDFVDVATGSLGQGLSVGVGMALDARLSGLDRQTFVLMGDGELAEGSVWEASAMASYRKLGNLCAILDINRLGQNGETALGHHLETYRVRFEAFGWKTRIIDGHDMEQILHALDEVGSGDQPLAIIAGTIKGKGIPFTEDKEGWHGKPLSKDQARQAIEHLSVVAQTAEGWKPKLPKRAPEPTPVLPVVAPTPPYSIGKKIATRKAAGEALTRLGERDQRVVVLDGDVGNSTYTDLFGKKFPDRFFECYIDEQNMTGVALGLASMGRTAFCSTFAAFFSRALDQLRMSAISRGNIKLIGTHAGVSIGEDGPSQMALEDLAWARALVGSTVLYPCDAVSTERLVDWVASQQGLCYLRAARIETPVIYGPGEIFEPGGAKILKQTGQDALTVVAAGITVYEAIKARELLAEEGLPFKLIDAYSIKPLASRVIWEAARETRNRGTILTVEDHYAQGGLGDAVAGELSSYGARVHKLAVRELPRSGKPEELLALYGIDAQAIADKVRELAGGRKLGRAA